MKKMVATQFPAIFFQKQEIWKIMQELKKSNYIQNLDCFQFRNSIHENCPHIRRFSLHLWSAVDYFLQIKSYSVVFPHNYTCKYVFLLLHWNSKKNFIFFLFAFSIFLALHDICLMFLIWFLYLYATAFASFLHSPSQYDEKINIPKRFGPKVISVSRLPCMWVNIFRIFCSMFNDFHRTII